MMAAAAVRLVDKNALRTLINRLLNEGLSTAAKKDSFQRHREQSLIKPPCKSTQKWGPSLALSLLRKKPLSENLCYCIQALVVLNATYLDPTPQA